MQITAHMINAPDTPLRPNTQKVLRDLNLSSDRAFSRAEVLEAMRKAIPPVDASVRMAVDMELSQANPADFDAVLLPGDVINAEKDRNSE